MFGLTIDHSSQNTSINVNQISRVLISVTKSCSARTASYCKQQRGCRHSMKCEYDMYKHILAPICAHLDSPTCAHRYFDSPTCAHRHFDSPTCAHRRLDSPTCTHRRHDSPACAHVRLDSPICTHRHLHVHRDASIVFLYERKCLNIKYKNSSTNNA